MKRLFLVLALFLPLSLEAQQNDLGSRASQPGVAALPHAKASKTDDGALSARADSSAGLSPESSSSQQAKAKSSTSEKQPTESQPKFPGSMVGYIDNPIVESQVRIRFDAAFDDPFPDRSEFFYAKCGCYRGLQGAPSPANLAFDPNAPGPGPGVPTAVNFQQLFMDVEYSPQRRFSVFAEVPIRWLQAQGAILPPIFGDQAGISDVMAGFKFAAVASEGTYVTFQFKSYFPSGDASNGLGTNHYSVEPSLLLYQRLSDRLRVEGQVGDWHPIGGSAGVPVTNSQGFAGDVFFYGVGPSYTVYRGHGIALTPVLELFGWHVVNGFETSPGAAGAIDGVATDVGGTNIVNLKFGVRTSVGLHNSFYVGFGQQVTHDFWYRHIVRLEYRYVF
jgi:hypothetical protein